MRYSVFIFKRNRNEIRRTISDSFSVRKYSRWSKLSTESIGKYLNYFQEVFLLFEVPKFSYSLKAQQVSQKKIYVIDQGLANVYGFKFTGKWYDIGSVEAYNDACQNFK